jgi:hypothetical protein
LRISAILLPLLSHIHVTQYADDQTRRMDDTPKHLLDELRTDLLGKRLGQIALAILLGEAALRFVNSLVWYLLIPIFGRALENHTASVLFEARHEPLSPSSDFSAHCSNSD